MFKIGDFSKLTMISVRMLRYYDEMGLFKPAEIDLSTGYRYYSAKQITNLNLIISLRDMGFNVSDITIAVNEQSYEKMKDILKQKEAEMKNNIKIEEGEFSNIAPAYNYLGQWIEENGYGICGTARQLPLKGPCNEANHNDYLTEIQVPVKKL
jgi:DNA-binding transcriptional MerR regulator